MWTLGMYPLHTSVAVCMCVGATSSAWFLAFLRNMQSPSYKAMVSCK